MLSFDIVRKPIITEKSMNEMANKKYTFLVHKNANKVEIKKAIEEIFEVEVEKVATANYIGKAKRVGVHRGKRADYKKAVVTLSGDKAIELFENQA